ncbi:MAG: hypothetical protein QW518_07290 [Thermofilaceae archaeon]
MRHVIIVDGAMIDDAGEAVADYLAAIIDSERREGVVLVRCDSPSAELFLDQNKKTVCVKRGEKKICGELKNCGKLVVFIRQFDECRAGCVVFGNDVKKYDAEKDVEEMETIGHSRKTFDNVVYISESGCTILRS